MPPSPVYQVKKRYPDGRGAARVNMEGDLNVSFPKTVTTASSAPTSPRSASKRPAVDADDDEAEGRATRMVDGASDDDLLDGAVPEDDFDEQDIGGLSVAWKFLLAGGIAGLGGCCVRAEADVRSLLVRQSRVPPRPPLTASRSISSRRPTLPARSSTSSTSLASRSPTRQSRLCGSGKRGLGTSGSRSGKSTRTEGGCALSGSATVST